MASLKKHTIKPTPKYTAEEKLGNRGFNELLLQPTGISYFSKYFFQNSFSFTREAASPRKLLQKLIEVKLNLCQRGP